MDWLQAVILGMVQGLTEFLPVSSSGHLVLFQKILGIQHHDLVFDVAVHVGTLCSVVTVYFALVVKMLRRGIFRKEGIKGQTSEGYLIYMILMASLPTALIGFLLKDTFESLFSNIFAVGICLVITGILLFLTRKKAVIGEAGAFDDLSNIRSIGWRVALLIGLAQSFAIAPGISRSGATIATALLLNVPGSIAASFSFMIAIPAIVGAAFLQIIEIQQWSAELLGVLALGFFVSYVSGVLALKFVIKIVRKGRLSAFSAYLWLVGIGALVWSFTG